MERSSVIESRTPKKAEPKARKRHELSSGIMRRRRVEAWVATESSGGSVGAGARVKERGFSGGEGGAVPKPAKEKVEDEDDGGLWDPFVG